MTQLLTTYSLAHKLNTTASVARRLIRTGVIPAVNVPGAGPRVDVRDVQRWIDRSKQQEDKR